MAVKIPMPKLGMAMKEGVLVKWLKEDGVQVEKEERIAVVMSKKITYEVQAPGSGILRHTARIKETKPVGAPIAYITGPGEEIPVEDVAALPAAEAAPDEAAPAAAKGKEKKPFVPASPAARRLAKEKGVDLTEVEGTGPKGRVVEADIDRYVAEQAAKKEAEPLATSSAKWLARKHGIELAQVPGSGPGGRVTEKDVDRFMAGAPAAVTPPPSAATVPYTGMRQTIGEHMVNSLQQAAQVTVTTEIDVTELIKLRAQLKTEFSLTYTDLLIKAVAKALKQHPQLNSTLIGDEIHLLPEIHIGMAVALDDGLIVPVVRNAGQKDLQEIAQETQQLAIGSREGTLLVDEVTGSTFTITNLGGYGADFFTPIINLPEAAILGVGRIVEKPAIFEGEITKRSMMTLSLTIDHRLVDGAPGAAFLRDLGAILNNPYRILIG